MRLLAGDLSDAGYAMQALDQSRLEEVKARYGSPSLAGSFAQVIDWCSQNPEHAAAMLRELDAVLLQAKR